MKEIPTVAARVVDNTVTVGALAFNGSLPVVPDGILGFTEYQSGFRRGEPMLVIDAVGFNEGSFDAALLKGLNARGKEIWVSTPVRDLDDLFDAFSTGLDYVVAPTHFAWGPEDLKEMHDVSDRVVPAVFAVSGKAYGGGPVEAVLRDLFHIGFETAAVFDTDGSIPDWEWERIFSTNLGIVPYAPGKLEWDAETYFRDDFRTFS